MVLPEDPLEGLPSSFVGERTVDPAALATVAGDASRLRGRPAARVRPRRPEDVAILVRWARASRCPLVARGGGTSLNGESVPSEGAVVVDLSGWDSIGEVDRRRRTIRVGPGVNTHALQRRLAGSGWFFPPNPGSWRSSTIGGNVATNASGPRSLRYGPTRRWVRELGAVLGTGEEVRLGTTLAKRSLGPDLLGLFVGSEGTLGILTEIVLGLAPEPARRLGLVVPLPEDHSLSRIAIGLLEAGGLGRSALEYVDRACAEALSTVPGSRIPSGSALLLAEIESLAEADESEALDRWARTLPGLGCTVEPLVYPDADRLWTLRGESGSTLDERLGPRVREDVVVPVERLDELLRDVGRIAGRFGVGSVLYGHVGEGNLHPNFLVDPASTAASGIRRALVEAARGLGGSGNGEHGVGSLKRECVGAELGAPQVRMLRAAKASCDPDGILNPGKLYPDG